MLIRRIMGETRRLAESQDEYITLSIRDSETIVDGEVIKHMSSAWEPTPKEMETLQRGGALVCNMVFSEAEERTAEICIPTEADLKNMRDGASVMLTVPGTVHPPVKVFVVNKETLEKANWSKSDRLVVISIMEPFHD